MFVFDANESVLNFRADRRRRARHGASWNLDNANWWNHRHHDGKIEKRWHLVQSELRPTGCQGEAEDAM